MVVPLSADDEVRAQRCMEYARSTVVLDEDHEVPAAAGIYELALCNGLAVIVAAHWPGSDVKGNRQVKSPKVLLEAIVSELAKTGQTGDVLFFEQSAPQPSDRFGRTSIWGEDLEPEPGVRVEVAVFREALTVTAPILRLMLSRRPPSPNAAHLPSARSSTDRPPATRRTEPQCRQVLTSAMELLGNPHKLYEEAKTRPARS